MDDYYLGLIIALLGLSRKAVRDVTFFGLLIVLATGMNVL